MDYRIFARIFTQTRRARLDWAHLAAKVWRARKKLSRPRHSDRRIIACGCAGCRPLARRPAGGPGTAGIRERGAKGRDPPTPDERRDRLLFRNERTGLGLRP